MTFDFARAMREATALTRSGKLDAATKAIRTALIGIGEEKLVAKGAAAEKGDERNASGSAMRRLGAPVIGATGGNQARSRRPMPLGAVITALRGLKGQTARLGRGQARPLGVLQIPQGAEYRTRTFVSDSGRLTYKLYVPRNLPTAAKRPLIVMLHGCTQDADDFAVGTRMNELAEEIGFLVAYPEQSNTANPMSCWNWFDPNHQARGAGEPSLIAGLSREIIEQFDIDDGHVFVAGLSAGGAMAAVLGASYPDVYKGIAVHSGLAAGSAVDVASAFAAMRGGQAYAAARASAPSDPRMIVFHGDADQTVHPCNGERIFSAYTNEKVEVTETSSSGGRTYLRRISRSGRIEHWLIRGAGHAWSGGSSKGTHTDPTGPDASRELIRFFLGEAKANEQAIS